MGKSDEYLLERWHNHMDPQAFREIVQRHGSAVYAVCCRMLRNHADAADVTQECFLEVLRNRADSSPRKLGAWLHGMATNRSLMHLRAGKRRRTREAAYAEQQVMQTASDESELPGLLDEAIEDLPEELREPVVAHFLYGRSHASIARELGIPRRTVSNRIQRGLMQMGAFLRSRGVTASATVLATSLAAAKANAAALPGAISESLARYCLQEAALTASGAATGAAAATSAGGLLAVKHVLAAVAVLAAVVSGSIWWAVRGDTGNVAANLQPRVTEPAPAAEARPQRTEAATPAPEQTGPQMAETAAAETSAGSLGSISGTVQAKDAEYHTEKIRSALQAALSGSQREQSFWKLLFTENIQPAAGVTVALEAKGVRREALTDENGRYQFSQLAPGGYEIQAAPPPEAVKTPEKMRQEVKLGEAEAKEGVDFSFSVDTVTCKGRVTNAAGDAIPGARVEAVPLDIVPYSGDDGFDRIRSAAVETSTDNEGLYELRGLMPAGFREVQDYLAGSTHLPEYGHTYTVRAAADGYASVKIVAPALQTDLVEFCTVMIKQAEKLPFPQKVGLAPNVILPVAPGNTLEGINFVLFPEARISGTVSDTRGQVLPEAKVRLAPEKKHEGDPAAFLAEPFVPDWTATGGQGTFFIGSVPGGTYVFEVDAGAGAQQARNAALSVRPGDILEDVRVVVEAAADRGRIEGVVAEADTGQPVGAFQLWILKVDSPHEPSPRHGNVTQDSGTGGFIIDGITAGLAAIEVKAEGYATQRLEVQVEPGRTSALRVSLAREGMLRGYVTRNGQPSAYGYVTFPGWEGAPYGGTGEDGHYEVKTLPAGQYLVKYNMWLYEDRRGGAQAVCFRAVEVQAGHATEVDVQYDGAGVVHGAFSGPPDANWRVELRDLASPDETSLRAGTWKFEKNARYEIPDVPPGTYRVVAYCNGPDGTPREQSQTVTLADNGVAEVDFSF